MSIPPPKALAPRKVDDNPLNAALEHEVLAEKAATYGRLLARLEKALKALREFEAGHDSISLTADPGPLDPGLREDGLTGRRAFALASPRSEKRAIEDEHQEPHSIPRSADPGPLDPGLREGGLSGRRAFALASPRTGERNGEEEPTGEDEHEALIAEAGEALWHVVIQRDLCGFRNHELFYREYDIPAAVRLRMGLRPRTGQ